MSDSYAGIHHAMSLQLQALLVHGYLIQCTKKKLIHTNVCSAHSSLAGVSVCCNNDMLHVILTQHLVFASQMVLVHIIAAYTWELGCFQPWRKLWALQDRSVS